MRTYAGLLEIAPEWVAQHRAEVQVLDVRSAAELDGELGRLEAVQHIPLGELRARVAELATDRPIVVVCQTGKRSGMGTVILTQAGITQAANIAGGMARWRELGLPG